MKIGCLMMPLTTDGFMYIFQLSDSLLKINKEGTFRTVEIPEYLFTLLCYACHK